MFYFLLGVHGSGILRVMCTAVKNNEKLASEIWSAW